MSDLGRKCLDLGSNLEENEFEIVQLQDFYRMI